MISGTVGLYPSGAAAAAEPVTDFYQPPTSISGNPGDLIRSAPFNFYLDPMRKIKAPARAQRVMYVSTGLDGAKTAVTGSILTPTTRWLGRGPRPVVSYAVGTQGMGDQCAPSRQLAAGSEFEGALIKGLLLKGYTVAITDYQGLGTPGTHPFLNGAVLGKNVLDAARVATHLPTDAVAATAPVYILGYSEGGNAAAAALEQRATYARELPVVAGSVGAVPSDISKLGPTLDGKVYAAFELYVIIGIDAAYPQLNVRDSLNAKGKSTLDAAAQSCVMDALTRFAFVDSRALTTDGSSLTDLMQRPDIAAVLADMKLGQAAPDVPVLISYSRFDDIIPPEQNVTLARDWCAQGTKVRTYSGFLPGHIIGQGDAYSSSLAFFAARNLKLPMVSECGRI